jgi:murein L,D-transpeptidase YafK
MAFLAAGAGFAHNRRMRGRTAIVVGWVGLAGIASLTGCNPLDRFRPVKIQAPPPAAAALADDDDHLAWAESERYLVVVRKSCHTLDVYRRGDRVRSFPAVFGLNGQGSKVYEGDMRTPSGLYMIVDKRPHPRWRHFLLLDYPNVQDLHSYWLAMESGGLPRRGDEFVGAGGAVGIHGTDKPSLNAHNVDWTWGCISLQNPDIDDLTALVPVGTLVLIED